MPKLPKKIIAIENADKAFHERWYPKRNMLNIPHPFRACLLGPPNVGKTTVIKNMIIRQYPPFEEIFVIHCDPDNTHEYDDLGEEVHMLGEIPAPEEWEGINKTLVVIDDLELKTLKGDQKRNLDRLFGYVSTHKNISVMLTSQDPFNVPPIVRRCSNLWILWRCPDLDSMAVCARKTGMRANNFNTIFNRHLLDTKDSLWMDSTDKTPYPLRKNGFTLLQKVKGDKAKKQEQGEDQFNIVPEVARFSTM